MSFNDSFARDVKSFRSKKGKDITRANNGWKENQVGST